MYVIVASHIRLHRDILSELIPLIRYVMAISVYTFACDNICYLL